MAAIGHLAVGMAVGRVHCPRDATRAQLAKAMLAYCAVSMLPDADVIAFALGIPYEHQFGHRGATHSLVFALLVAAIVAAVTRRIRVGVLALIAVGTHGLLDMLTNGGLGVALFWPFSVERFFFPWRPLPVAPIGAHMLSARGLYVVAVEMIYFLPLFIFATFPRKRR